MRDIDVSKGLDSLSEADLIYLRDRGRLTPEQEVQYLGGIDTEPPASTPLSEVPNVGDVSTAPEPPAPDGGSPEEDTEVRYETEEDPYEDWSKPDLVTQAKARDLEVAKKDTIPVLAEKIRAWDEENGEED